MLYLSNSFSIQMVPEGGNVSIRKLTLSQAKRILKHDSGDPYDMTPRGKDIFDLPPANCIIGHADLCAIVNNLLGMPGAGYRPNRESILLRKGDRLIVAQYIGQRLPEGARELPEGAKIEFYDVRIIDDPEPLKDGIINLKSKLSEIKRLLYSAIHYEQISYEDKVKQIAEKYFPEIL